MLKKVLILSIILGLTAIGASAWGPVLLDRVDIGNLASETGHTMTGWGPIEPATHGGNWGGFNVSGEDCRVTYAGTELDHPVDRSASVTLTPKNFRKVKTIKMRVLDGAGNDDFQVFVKDRWGNQVLIFQYVSDPSTTEVWKEHEINVRKLFLPRKEVEVTIQSTASNWSLHSTYGQLGIDWIEIWK